MCQEKGISLSKAKMVYCKNEVEFAGYILNQDGYRMSPKITNVIADFPTPANRTQLRGYFGLANQLGSSTNAIAKALEPMRPLMQQKNDYI